MGKQFNLGLNKGDGDGIPAGDLNNITTATPGALNSLQKKKQTSL